MHARSYKQARHVLTAQGCDPEDAFDQRRHAQQHRLLSIPKKTSNICTKTSTHAQRRTYTHRHPLSRSHTHSLLCLQKAGTNDRLCVLCAHSAAPWTHFTHPAENRPLCSALSFFFSILFSLSLHFLLSLEN